MRSLINAVSILSVAVAMFLMGESKGIKYERELIKAKCDRAEYLKIEHQSYKCRLSHSDDQGTSIFNDQLSDDEVKANVKWIREQLNK